MTEPATTAVQPDTHVQPDTQPPATALPTPTAQPDQPDQSRRRLRQPRRFLQHAALAVLQGPLELLSRWYPAYLALVRHSPPKPLAALGRGRAQRAYDRALRRVPAYQAFVGGSDPAGTDVAAAKFPETDKATYIRRYPIGERCVDGRIPARGVTIDESSGSTGTPHNWVRRHSERAVTHTFVSFFARYCYGAESWITINAFSMGAWATGFNMGAALERGSVVKNTGPDVDKILSTLELFGTSHRYLVCGYPPFLKHLIDAAAERGFPLGDYRLMGLVGGEGMSEGLRDYLALAFRPVYSGYGATDLEIGLAGETPTSVAVRRAAREDPALRAALFGTDDPRLPMVFQYNPLSHHVTTNADGELVVTITRLNVLSPRIAYNVHDAGGVATYADVAAGFRAAGRDISELDLPVAGDAPLRLPFLWVHGRSDATVSAMGANLYPEDVEQALYDQPDLAARVNSFCVGLHERPDGTQVPLLAFELRDQPGDERGDHGPGDPTLRARFTDGVVSGIASLNADFRTALDEHADSVRPVVELHALGTGPFARDRGRIKQVRMLTPAG